MAATPLESRRAICSLAQDGAKHRGHGHADQQWDEPAGAVPDQNVVDENFRKSRGHDTGRDEREADDHQQADRRLRAAQFAHQQAQALRFVAQFPERLGSLHGEHDTGERKIQFRHVDAPPSDRRIVDVDAVANDALQHHEMIEVPVNDAGHRQFVQCRGLLAKTLGGEAETARRPDDVARLAAVARDPAGDAELLQRDPGAMMSEHHGQRRSPAFDGFHLQDCGRPLHRFAGVAPGRAGVDFAW